MLRMVIFQARPNNAWMKVEGFHSVVVMTILVTMTQVQIVTQTVGHRDRQGLAGHQGLAKNLYV